ncbi:tRNA (adenine(58)-N(1))-methyltransferase catalytic subunit TRMT61A [Platysternon megacephalum]|uniref:tRNA (Adenine(58)-N(1))-methyltransferase catalytic subunit TRMT61A n=1 Tax=Platysternon megacephalum TaxID=55544 RepID=A0A4D9EZC2_9SAUR|nr:tRNA (adenine(58)-N(1))-methyltransferase catalytic subunit TRMT61A [Platysternon megacephalum]
MSFTVWDLSLEKVIYTAGGFLDTPILTSTMNGQLLLVFFDGSQLVKVFDLTDSCQLLHQVHISADIPIHKDHSILVSKNSVKDYVLFAYRNGKEAMVFSARKGKVVAKLTSQEPVVAIQGVAVTKEYFLVIFRCPFMRQRDILHIELFSVRTFIYTHTLKGCCNDFISTFFINHLASHLVAFSPIPNTNTTEIVLWNLESEDHKHLAKLSSVPVGGVCSDLRYCLAFCNGENYLRSWNLASKINDQSLTATANKGKKTNGIQEIVTMQNYPRYVVCRSLNSGVITVWNIVKSKCKGKAVTVERGLVENTDVVLVRDMKLFVLTDKGMASFTEASRPIFQTLLTYDLLKKKYIKKKTGLYIIYCQNNEYKILDGGLLFGLSENRDHFVIWNMETGFVKDRIKPEYKDKAPPQPILLGHLMSKDTRTLYKDILSKRKRGKGTTVLQRPWERRNESKTAKKRRLENEVKQELEKLQQLANEKYNAIDQYLLSGDEKVIVCSYYAHHLSVFSLQTLSHLHTLESRTSMLFLHNAALTYTGSHLVLSNYSDDEKISYITLWNLETGKTLLLEALCLQGSAVIEAEPEYDVGILDGDYHCVISKIKVWDTFHHRHKIIPGYESLQLTINSKLHILEGGAKAVLLAGEVSLWDLDNCSVMSVFTPDSNISCLTVALDRKTILVGMSDSPALIILKKSSAKVTVNSTDRDLFGEESTSSEEESEEN